VASIGHWRIANRRHGHQSTTAVLNHALVLPATVQPAASAASHGPTVRPAALAASHGPMPPLSRLSSLPRFLQKKIGMLLKEVHRVDCAARCFLCILCLSFTEAVKSLGPDPSHLAPLSCLTAPFCRGLLRAMSLHAAVASLQPFTALASLSFDNSGDTSIAVGLQKLSDHLPDLHSLTINSHYKHPTMCPESFFMTTLPSLGSFTQLRFGMRLNDWNIDALHGPITGCPSPTSTPSLPLRSDHRYHDTLHPLTLDGAEVPGTLQRCPTESSAGGRNTHDTTLSQQYITLVLRCCHPEYICLQQRLVLELAQCTASADSSHPPGLHAAVVRSGCLLSYATTSHMMSFTLTAQSSRAARMTDKANADCSTDTATVPLD
jgi:hypothetical protein